MIALIYMHPLELSIEIVRILKILSIENGPLLWSWLVAFELFSIHGIAPLELKVNTKKQLQFIWINEFWIYAAERLTVYSQGNYCIYKPRRGDLNLRLF